MTYCERCEVSVERDESIEYRPKLKKFLCDKCFEMEDWERRHSGYPFKLKIPTHKFKRPRGRGRGWCGEKARHRKARLKGLR